MSDFDVSDPENRLDVNADRTQFSLIGFHLKSTIQEEQVFNCQLKAHHAAQLKSLLDTWLFQENGGKVGHMAWELRQFADSLFNGMGEERELPRTQAHEIVEEIFEQGIEQNIPVPDMALELSLSLANLLESWVAARKRQALLQ